MPAKKPLSLLLKPFLKPNIKKARPLKIKRNKLVMVELTPKRLIKLVKKVTRTKNNK